MYNEPKNFDPTLDTNTEEPEGDHTLPLPGPAGKGQSRASRFNRWYLDHKKLTIPATIFLLIIIISVIPLTRYKAAGLVLKRDFSLKVVDSTTNSPVSGALVSSGSITAVTDGNGRAVLKKLPVGTRSVIITKKHYKNGTSSLLVPIMDQKGAPSVKLTATGRQVLVKVINYVSQKPVAKVEISAGEVEATTDKDGQALLVLPANAAAQEATLSLDGYLNSTVKVTLSNVKDDSANTFKLVPSGSVYFMSKRTGKLDLMKSNIDGSDSKVVIAGTGSEQDYRTSLVPSAGFEHVVLQVKRSPGDPSPQLYLVTSDDKLQSIDSGNAEFYIHGWSGQNLIYSLTRNDLQNWQQGKHKLKSYDATSGKITMLDQSAGTDEETRVGENYGIVSISGSLITYAKNWVGNYYDTVLSGKQHSLHSILSNGQNHRLVAAYDAENYSVQYRQYSPTGFYIYQNGNVQEDKYFEYTVSGQPKEVSLDADKFYQSYPTYSTSPNGQSSAWTDLRDGKDVILVGDSNGNNSKPLASLEEYSIYGWLDDNYLILSKKSNELYVISVSGGEPVKIGGYQSVNGAYRYY